MSLKFWFSALTALSFFSIPSFASSSGTWIIRKSYWSAQDERAYSQFIQALGESGCNQVDKCLKSAANPYRASNPPGVVFHSDCADFPYTLRSYFAWKNGLPFSYATEADPISGDADNRYSLNGNRIVQRRDIIDNGSHQNNAPRLMEALLDQVSTAMFRVPPYTDSTGRMFPDFYPVSIDRQGIKPGTVYYDPSGHVIVIYKVESDGIIRYFDAHPDNTVTHGMFGEKFSRSRVAHGAGFKSFRPVQLVGYRKDASGDLIGGYIVGAKNAEMPDYSLEEYYGNHPTARGSAHNDGRFYVGNRAYNFYEYVRVKMAGAGLKYNPVSEMRQMMEGICNDFQDRVQAVNVALENRVQDIPHPDMLPRNIYGTEGTWETFSSPSRDARLKTSVVELKQTVEDLVSRYKQHDPTVEYKGQNLAADLRAAYNQEADKCQITYTKSNGQPQVLGYRELIRRLFTMSFDPYNCPELRWGAKPGTAEFSSCPDNRYKLDWYNAEQRLRNQIQRDYMAVMNFRLDELQRHVKGSGVDQAPDVDLERDLTKGFGLPVSLTRAGD